MDINIILLPDSDSVFLVDDRFYDGESITISDDSVVYITVLPLEATRISYTVKLVGPKVASNTSLALSCKTGEREYVLKLGNRYHVYSANHNNLPEDTCRKFFYYVKGRHFSLASELLGDISPRPGEKELDEFFADYSDLICVKGQYYAVDGAGVGHRCDFTIKGGKIDNISID